MAKPSEKHPITGEGNVASTCFSKEFRYNVFMGASKSLLLSIMTISYNTIFESHQRTDNKKKWY